MAREVHELPIYEQGRATIIGITLNGITGHMAYLNESVLNDADYAIRSAVKERFSEPSLFRNEQLEYEGDVSRICDSYLVGACQSILKIQLRTFTPVTVIDHTLEFTVYWQNSMANADFPDLVAYHDCHEYDWEVLASQLEAIEPVVRDEYAHSAEVLLADQL